MAFALSLLNNISVSLYGSILSASFCDAITSRRKKIFFICAMLCLPFVQGIAYILWGDEFVRKIYPLVVHVPLFFILAFMTKRALWPFFSILMAYLCCQLRRWIALFIVSIFSGGKPMLDLVELIVTVPLLLLLLRFAAPVIRPLSGYNAKMQCQFGVIPLLYYVFDYTSTVYTNLLSNGGPVFVEFMPFVCCAAYLSFLLYNSTVEHSRNELRETQKTLSIQLKQAVREIDSLRESQTLASQYRHDMRHHLQYVSTCIKNGQEEQALSYMSGICKEIEAQKVVRYCENEAANLILSSFASRAAKAGIQMNIKGSFPASTRLSDSDLCVLLSNALENAINACKPLASSGIHCVIDVQFYNKDDRLFLQIENPFQKPIVFENQIPVSHEPGHGMGIQSICAIVDHYGGIYTFLTQDQHFILRLSI